MPTISKSEAMVLLILNFRQNLAGQDSDLAGQDSDAHTEDLAIFG
jgi:hypothetical protein